jgi:hypothetical protein
MNEAVVYEQFDYLIDNCQTLPRTEEWDPETEA